MTHPNREELAGRPANDEAGLFYDLDDMAGHITLKVDHQSFAIGPEFEDTPDGKLEREWFKCMIHLAMRRVIEKALAAAALRQSPSVEEVARVIDPEAIPEQPDHLKWQGRTEVALAKAQAIIQLFEGRGD